MQGRVAAVTDVAVGVLQEVSKLAVLQVGVNTGTVEGGGVMETTILVDGGTVDIGRKGVAAADEERDAVVTTKMMGEVVGAMIQVKIAGLETHNSLSLSDLFDVIKHVRCEKL
jgi:hypothetical protein